MSIRTMFLTDGRGNWWRIDYPAQCRHKVTMAGQCQREAGHEGTHWCYDGAGWFCQDFAKPDGREPDPWGIASKCTPPGHKAYRSPAKMQGQRWTAKRMQAAVTDPRLIARLQRGEMRRGESITGPVGWDDVGRQMNEGEGEAKV